MHEILHSKIIKILCYRNVSSVAKKGEDGGRVDSARPTNPPTRNFQRGPQESPNVRRQDDIIWGSQGRCKVISHTSHSLWPAEPTPEPHVYMVISLWSQICDSLRCCFFYSCPISVGICLGCQAWRQV